MSRVKERSDCGNYNSPFALRLRELMKENKTTQDALADAIGVVRQTISQYANGSIRPSADNLLSIAEHFNVSTDYLLGRVEASTTDVTLQQFCEVTGLSEDAVEMLLRIKDSSYHLSVLNEILKMESFFEMLATLHFYASNNDPKRPISSNIAKILRSHSPDKAFAILNSKAQIESIIMEIAMAIEVKDERLSFTQIQQLLDETE